jgi:hypothetical protein
MPNWEAFELTPSQVDTVKTEYYGGVDIPLLGRFTAGQTWPSVDGTRLLLIGAQEQVLYLQVQGTGQAAGKAGRLFQQHREGFKLAIQNAPFVGNQAAQVVMKKWLAFMLGVARRISPVVRIADYTLTAIGVVAWTAQHEEDIRRWIKVIQVVEEGRELLSECCPTLYGKIVEGVLAACWSLGTGSPGESIGTFTPPDLMPRRAGSLMGRKGSMAKLEKDARELLEFLRKVVKKIITHVVVNQLKTLAKEQIQDLANYHILFAFAAQQIKIEPAESEAIAREIGESASRIGDTINKLEGALAEAVRG